MRHLLGEARRLGIDVNLTHIEEPDLLGYYLADHRLIVLRAGMTRAQTRSVLAHELGHARHGHTCSDALAERQADIYAARLLIDPARYAAIERINSDQHYIADELGVTVDVVFTFEAHCLTKLRGITYAIPRMGLGQWAYREVISA